MLSLAPFYRFGFLFRIAESRARHAYPASALLSDLRGRVSYSLCLAFDVVSAWEKRFRLDAEEFRSGQLGSDRRAAVRASWSASNVALRFSTLGHGAEIRRDSNRSVSTSGAWSGVSQQVGASLRGRSESCFERAADNDWRCCVRTDLVWHRYRRLLLVPCFILFYFCTLPS